MRLFSVIHTGQAARRALLVASVLTGTACASARPSVTAAAPSPSATPVAVSPMPARATLMTDTLAGPPQGIVLQALTTRVATLRTMGGSCQAYATVLEGAIAAGRLEVRPFMWRVGNRLASAQALSSGAITVAREVDSLNVGVRSLEDVVHSAEHEAAHVAFSIPSGAPYSEEAVNRVVGECRR